MKLGVNNRRKTEDFTKTMEIKQHIFEQSRSQGRNQKQCQQTSVRIKEFSNVAEYKLDIQKSVEFLCNSTENYQK